MKKKLFFLLPLLLLSVFILSGCNGDSSETESVDVYTVFFHDNYQGIYTKIVVEAGEVITLPAEPSRTGYDFEGWMLSEEEDATETFDQTQPINENITIFAKWSKKDNISLVTLVFLNYRNADQIVAIDKGSMFPVPDTPIYDENETHAFVNWFTDIECTQVYDFSSEVNDDLVLYAGWNQTIAYITLDYNFAGSPTPVTNPVTIGETVVQIELPTRDRYDFVGWFTQRVGGEEFDLDTPISTDMTLYAHWSRNAYTVIFDTNTAQLDDGIDLSYVVSKEASIQTEADAIENGMTLTGHDFAGWYSIQIDPDSEDPLPSESLVDLTSITDDMTVYAAWTLQEYVVEFDYNYVDAPTDPADQIIKYLHLLSSPTVTDRDGYLFGGWFTEPECINQFTIDDTPITEDIVLYAKWIEESTTFEDVTITYVYDLGNGVVQYTTLDVEYNGTVGSNAPANPDVEDYLFGGWYKESTFTTSFSNSSNLTEDLTIYGKMLKKYTFEAEAVDLTGMPGKGTSTELYEEQLIMDYSFIGDGNIEDVSNGYFVRALYYNGAFINFEIIAEEATTDAVLYLRVSSESYQFFTTQAMETGGELYNYLSDTEFKITLNSTWTQGSPDTWLNYGGLYMPMSNTEKIGDVDDEKTDFENIYIISGLNLQQGMNNLTLYVSNNNDHGGTFGAEAPIIDCIYIYSSVELTMNDYEFYTKDGVITGS